MGPTVQILPESHPLGPHILTFPEQTVGGDATCVAAALQGNQITSALSASSRPLPERPRGVSPRLNATSALWYLAQDRPKDASGFIAGG